MGIARVITLIWIPGGGHDTVLIHMARVETTHAKNICLNPKRSTELLWER